MHQNGKSVGTLVVSLDLRTDGQTILAAQTLPTRLLSLLDARRIAATWALAEPGSAAFIERLRRSSLDHEVALLCEPEWGGIAVGRTTFARQLARRLGAAKRAGIPISTLALRTTELRDDLDLIVKQELSVIRGRLQNSKSPDLNQQPKTVRFGVLYAPVSRVLPRTSAWSLWGSRRIWRKTLHRGSRAGGNFHLGIDAATLDEQHLKQVEAALQIAAELRDEGRLTIQTLRQLAAQQDRKRLHTPSRSVLRAA